MLGPSSLRGPLPRLHPEPAPPLGVRVTQRRGKTKKREGRCKEEKNRNKKPTAGRSEVKQVYLVKLLRLGPHFLHHPKEGWWGGGGAFSRFMLGGCPAGYCV